MALIYFLLCAIITSRVNTQFIIAKSINATTPSHFYSFSATVSTQLVAQATPANPSTTFSIRLRKNGTDLSKTSTIITQNTGTLIYTIQQNALYYLEVVFTSSSFFEDTYCLTYATTSGGSSTTISCGTLYNQNNGIGTQFTYQTDQEYCSYEIVYTGPYASIGLGTQLGNIQYYLLPIGNLTLTIVPYNAGGQKITYLGRIRLQSAVYIMQQFNLGFYYNNQSKWNNQTNQCVVTTTETTETASSSLVVGLAVVGGLVGIGIIVTIICCCCKYHKKKQKYQEQQNNSNNKQSKYRMKQNNKRQKQQNIDNNMNNSLNSLNSNSMLKSNSILLVDNKNNYTHTHTHNHNHNKNSKKQQRENNHEYKNNKNKNNKVKDNKDGDWSPQQICSICLSRKCNTRIKCGHIFHKKCLLFWFEHNQRCPNCLQQNNIINPATLISYKQQQQQKQQYKQQQYKQQQQKPCNIFDSHYKQQQNKNNFKVNYKKIKNENENHYNENIIQQNNNKYNNYEKKNIYINININKQQQVHDDIDDFLNQIKKKQQDQLQIQQNKQQEQGKKHHIINNIQQLQKQQKQQKQKKYKKQQCKSKIGIIEKINNKQKLVHMKIQDSSNDNDSSHHDQNNKQQ